MAKKEETVSLIDTFSEFKELKNIDRTTIGGKTIHHFPFST